MAMMEISIVPIGTGTASISGHVAAAVRIVEESGLEYELEPMGTVIVGDVGQLLALARTMHEQAFATGVVRVATTIKIDDRRDKPLTIAGKVRAVRDKLQ